MRAEADDPIQGRCPTCGQVVLLSIEARAQLVECPRCGHQGTGVVFVGIEAPLPVVLVQRRSERAPASEERRRGPASSARTLPGEAASRQAPLNEVVADQVVVDQVVDDQAVDDDGLSDEALAEAEVSDAYEAALSRVRGLDAPVGDGPGRDGDGPGRDERTLLMGDERTLLMGDARTLLMSDERTRLMLDSPVSRNEGRPRPAGRPGDEERTHLLLDPFDLEDARDTPLTHLATRLRPLAERLVGLGRKLDEQMDGRWPAALAVLGVACGILPPIFDYLAEDHRSISSVLASLVVLVGLTASALVWLAKLQRDDGVWDWQVAGARAETTIRRLLEDAEQLGRSPRYLKLQLGGVLLVWLGAIGSGLAACRSLVRVALGESDPPSVLRFVSGLLLVASVLLLRAAERATPSAATDPAELGEAIEAASKLPPIVDLSEPLPPFSVGDDSPLHRIVFALSEWRGRRWLDEAGYRAALERHLQRHLPGVRVERERRLGRSRREGVADLIVGGLVLIEVKHGFRQRSAERALARLNALSPSWSGKPMLVVIFDASREVVFDGATTPALIDLHRRLPMLTVRMPVRS
jgi:hypothetical protein